MTEIPEYTQTLNDLLERRAAEWTKDDLMSIVKGLREQSERWNAEQMAGSRKLTKTKQIQVPRGSLKRAIKNLKL